MENHLNSLQRLGQKASVAEVTEAVVNVLQWLAVALFILVENANRMTVRKEAIDMIDMFYRMVQPPQMRPPETPGSDEQDG